jgi:hypothetical protein
MKWRPQSVRALRALGRSEMPERVEAGGAVYTIIDVFKHDFFAATGLYGGPTGRAVLKVGRRADFLGLPMAWAGRFLAGREANIYERLHDLEGVPRFLGRVGRDGLLHEFVPGHPLHKGEAVGDDFFPRLRSLIGRIHAREMAYVDLEKCGNILVGDDGRPYLIDFQISWYWPARRGGRLAPVRWIRQILQTSDLYHLLKHQRRTRPDQLSEEEFARSYEPPIYIGLHRYLARPFTLLRRRTLLRMGKAEKARAGKMTPAA